MAHDETDRPRAVRRVGLLIAGLVAAVLAAGAALATLAVVTRFARAIVVPATRSDEKARVRRVDLDAGTITLDADADSRMPGRYSFWFDGNEGHARIGEIVGGGAVTVTRRIIGVDFGRLAHTTRGRFSGWYYLGPWELGVAYEDVTVETELGPAPAWVVPAERPSGRWAVLVHGWSVRRQECLRAVEVFRAAGYSCLLISYRNDGEGPESHDGRYALGDTEWRDVVDAIGFAEGRGAEEIVLVGWSMGGAIALQTELRDACASVTGLVLDSPAVDWRDILAFQGALNRLPQPVTRGVVASLGNAWGRGISGLTTPIGFDRLDVLSQADALRLPTLILASVDDGFVPSTGSAELARLRPDIVTYDEWRGARHAKLWNYDAARWNRTVADWLRAL